MKSVYDEIWRKLNQGQATVHTRIVLNIKNKTSGSYEEIELTPTDFSIENNSWTQNGGMTFPIGNVISKSVKVNINNNNDRFMNYDFNDGYFMLFSDVYENGTLLSQTMNEGTFYVDEVKITTYTIQITAYDYAGLMDTPFYIYTVDPQNQLLYATLWDYFVHLCDDVMPNLLGIELESYQHLYAIHLYADRFPNSTFNLSKIAYNGKAKTTLREAFGYVAQLACGNIIISDEYEVINGKIINKIDFVSYDLLDWDYYNGMTHEYQNLPVADGGDLSETITNTADGGTLGNPNAILLDNYISPPSFEYTNCKFTGVRLNYPVSQTDDVSYGEYVSSQKNVLDLENPLCETSTRTSSAVATAAQNIYSRINQPVRPFSGSFSCIPMAEFMDNVIVVDIDGVAHNSFIGEHTMNYLGTSEIANKTPTQSDNNRKYYS